MTSSIDTDKLCQTWAPAAETTDVDCRLTGERDPVDIGELDPADPGGGGAGLLPWDFTADRDIIG